MSAGLEGTDQSLAWKQSTRTPLLHALKVDIGKFTGRLLMTGNMTNFGNIPMGRNKVGEFLIKWQNFLIKKM